MSGHVELTREQWASIINEFTDEYRDGAYTHELEDELTTADKIDVTDADDASDAIEHAVETGALEKDESGSYDVYTPAPDDEQGDTTPNPQEARERFAARLEEAGVRERRFIDVKDGEKGTRTRGHQEPDNWLSADAGELHGNYGVHPGHGLIEFDVDDYDDELDTKKLDELPETFTVASAHTAPDEPGHRYYAVGNDKAVREVLKDVAGTLNPEPSWGEVKYEGKYVVGPGSHLDGCTKEWCDACDEPDGGYYEIAEDVAIATITAEDVAEVLRADPEIRDGQSASDLFDVDEYDGVHEPESDGESDEYDGDEWLTEDVAEDALDSIDPDVDYDEWMGVGFALVNHFGRSTGGHLFKQWSRGGSEWDDDAPYYAERAIEDAGNYPHDVAHLVNVAKAHGWDASAAAREAVGGDGSEVSEAAEAAENGDFSWKAARELYNSTENNSTSAANQMAARELMREYTLVTVTADDEIWYYDTDTGVYRDGGVALLRKRLAKTMGETYSRTRVINILHRIRSETYVDRDELGAPDEKVCVANGVLDLSDPENPELLDNSPEYRFTWRLEAEYDPDAEADRFKEFLGDVTRPADLPKLQEYAGTALRHWRQPRNLLAIVGPTDAGKGVFLRVLKSVFGGAENVASESLYTLAETRWGAAQLHRTPVNITNELTPGTLKNPHKVKNLAGEGDQISAERKGVDKFEFTPTASHFIATNQVPQVEHGDDAFYNRWLFVTFPDTVPPSERDTTLTSSITDDDTELSGVLNWLIEGLAKYDAGTGVTNERTIGQKEDMWSAYGDSVDRFIDKCLEVDPDSDALISKSDAYEAYKAMCNDIGLPTESKKKLTTKLKKKPGVTDKQSRSVDSETDGATKPYCYTSVELTGRGQQYLDRVVRTDALVDGQSQVGDAATDGGKPDRTATVRDAIVEMGGDAEPVSEDMVIGAASGAIGIMRARYALDDLEEQGEIQRDDDGVMLV